MKNKKLRKIVRELDAALLRREDAIGVARVIIELSPEPDDDIWLSKIRGENAAYSAARAMLYAAFKDYMTCST